MALIELLRYPESTASGSESSNLASLVDYPTSCAKCKLERLSLSYFHQNIIFSSKAKLLLVKLHSGRPDFTGNIRLKPNVV
jgi:hypothetical protein